MDNVVIAKNSNNAIAQGINDAVNGKWAYALNAGHASRSLYDLSVKKAFGLLTMKVRYVEKP